MVRKDRSSSIVWVGVGFLFCAGGLRLGVMDSGVPGAGFFPFSGGLVLAALSLVLLMISLVKKEKKSAESFFVGREEAKKVFIVLAVIFFYVLFLTRLGFLLTTFIFTIVMLKLEPRPWTFIIPAAILSAGFFYVLFQILLKVPLPGGFLGV